MAVNLKHTLGFLAGGYKNIAALKGISLPKRSAQPKYTSLLVGWDAADWHTLYPMLQEGKMPALAEVLGSGVHSKLATLDPPISPMLWTSVATSRWPSAHGVHGFTELQDNEVRAVRGTSVQTPTYFDFLEAQGVPATSVAWWPSHPAKHSSFGAFRVSNLAVSDDRRWLGEGIAPNVHNEFLESLLLKPEEVPPAAIASFFPGMELDSKDDVVRSVLKITTHALNVQLLATFALDYGPGGHASVYFDALDHYKHLGMKYAPPRLEGIPEDDFQKYQHIVQSAYRLHDLCLSELLTYLEPQGSVLVISDHGFVSGEQRIVSLPEHAGAPALEHRFHGIFAARGPLFKDPLSWTGLNLLDIAPILLAVHGIEAPTSMEGRVPIDFSGKEIVEVPQVKDSNANEGFSGDEALLRDLIALGYLEEHQAAASGGRLIENRYYLARSLRAEGQLAGAWKVIAPLVDQEDAPERYLQLAASVLAESGEFALLEGIVKRISSTAHLIWGYYEQLVHLSKTGTLVLPKDLSPLMPESLVVLWGKLLFKAGRLQELEVLLSNDAHAGVDVCNLRARLFLYNEDWDAALDAALDSLNQLFYQPALHGLAALCFAKMGMLEEAGTAKALQMKLMGSASSVPLFIVTGPPRSGTSLAMQLLEACGIPPVTDGLRAADDYNAFGYYEHEKVKNWTMDAAWLEQMRGRAVKIVEPLIQQAPLPKGHKIVVRMHRSLDAVLKSQRRLKGSSEYVLGFTERQSWEQVFSKTDLVLELDPHIEVIDLHFEDVIAAVQTDKVSEALELALDSLSKHVDKKVDISLLKTVISPKHTRF